MQRCPMLSPGHQQWPMLSRGHAHVHGRLAGARAGPRLGQDGRVQLGDGDGQLAVLELGLDPCSSARNCVHCMHNAAGSMTQITRQEITGGGASYLSLAPA